MCNNESITCWCKTETAWASNKCNVQINVMSPQHDTQWKGTITKHGDCFPKSLSHTSRHLNLLLFNSFRGLQNPSHETSLLTQCLFWHGLSSSLTKHSGPSLSIFWENLVNTQDNNNPINQCNGRDADSDKACFSSVQSATSQWCKAASSEQASRALMLLY